MLGAAAIGAVIAAASPQVAAADPGGLRFDAFAAVTPIGAYGMPNDAHGPEAELIVEVGVGSAVSRRFGRFFDLGLGLRYDYGGDDDEIGGDSLHVVAAPITAALVIPLGTTRELRAGVGLGPGFGLSPGFSMLAMLGASSEAAIAFAQRLRPDGFGLSLQVGIRFDLLRELNAEPDTYQDDQELFHIQLPFVRGGVTWR